jgi:flagellar hook-length control protein FliK
MSIELAPSPSEVKTPSAPANKAANDASSKSGKPGAGGATGFLAILGALGAAEDASAGAASSASALADADDGLKLLNGTVDNPLVGLDASTLIAQTLQMARADGQLKGEAAELPADAAGLAKKAGATAFGFDALAAGNLAVKADGAGAQQLKGVRKPQTLAADAKARDVQAESEAAGVSTAVAAPDAKSMFSLSKAEVVFAAVTAREVQAAQPQSTSAATPVREEQLADRGMFKLAASEVPAGSPEQMQSPVTGGGEGAVPVAVDAADTYIAEQVKYWISNDVQSAELKLDGVGSNPVEVSISMQGNEAHVAFRTDELQAREVIESATSQLKEMLLREGLVLSGVSVGTSGAGESGSQERNPRQGARAATVVAGVDPTANNVTQAMRETGRSLDLFV